jgi:hypothetical protein
METTLWLRESFLIGSTPDWICPTCYKGILTLDPKEFHFNETEESIRDHRHEDFDPEWIRYRFVGYLRCANPKCKELVTFLGRGNVEIHTYLDGDDSYSSEFDDIFVANYFSPPLRLFKIHEKCTTEISNQIVDAFALYWCDTSACANKIRIALEMIMNDHSVKRKYVSDKGKRKDVSLHSRIEVFGKKFPELKDHLIAIKWIGNSGSHVGKLERVDLIDAFSLLEHCIDNLYGKRDKELKSISKQINKNKRSRHRR